MADVQLDFKPYKHQKEAHGFLTSALVVVRFLVLVWHRRAGKTVFAIMELVLAALKATRERSRFGYVAPLLKQAKGVAWDYLKHFAHAVPGVVVNESEMSVTFPNGARVRLFGADNPDGLRGLYFDGIVLDEVADMKPQVWGGIVRPALADRQGWAIFIGTPKGVNLFSKLYYDAMRGEEGWKADMRRASETGVIPQEELAQLKATLSPSQYAQEMECDFAAAVDNVLLRLDEVLAAQQRTVQESEYRFAARVLALDVARYGDDRNCLCGRQGLVAFPPKGWRGTDLMETAGRCAASIEKFKPDAVFVDQGGYGAGVVDRLRQLGHRVIGVDFGGKAIDPRFENKRAEMWWTMAEWVKDGGVLPVDQELVADLTAPTMSYANARGRMQLESKDDLRARGLPSPDFGDGLAMTFAFPVAPRVDEYGRERQSRALTDFDPYPQQAPAHETPRARTEFDPYGGI